MSEIILKNLYMNGNKVPLMIRNGEIIYRMYTKLVFSVDTDSITFESTGGTYTINITANDNWNMTIPEFVTASVISGTGNTSITISTTGETSDTELTGNIVITCNGKTHTINVTQKANVIDYSTHYLTIIIEENGVLKWYAPNTSSYKTIQYSKDNGTTWTSVTSSSSNSGTSISVVSGDTLIFKGNNNSYATSASNYSSFRYSSVKFSVEGNVMSLIYGDDFINKKSFPSSTSYNFVRLFQNCNNINSAENLILPATELTVGCYRSMFDTSSGLTSAPSELPAAVLTNECYNNMFLFCKKIKYLKCLATNMSATNCLTNWVYNYGASTTTGTFVKKAGVTWPTGNSGIPNGWTVIEE